MEIVSVELDVYVSPSHEYEIKLVCMFNVSFVFNIEMDGNDMITLIRSLSISLIKLQKDKDVSFDIVVLSKID